MDDFPLGRQVGKRRSPLYAVGRALLFSSTGPQARRSPASCHDTGRRLHIGAVECRSRSRDRGDRRIRGDYRTLDHATFDPLQEPPHARHQEDSHQVSLRWVASALSDATGRFRNLRGHRDMRTLMAALSGSWSGKAIASRVPTTCTKRFPCRAPVAKIKRAG